MIIICNHCKKEKGPKDFDPSNRRQCKECLRKYQREKNRGRPSRYKPKERLDYIYIITNPAWPDYIKIGRS